MKYWCRNFTKAGWGTLGTRGEQVSPFSLLWSDSMPLWQWLQAIKYDGYLGIMTVMNWWVEQHKIFIKEYWLNGNGDLAIFSSPFFFCFLHNLLWKVTELVPSRQGTCCIYFCIPENVTWLALKCCHEKASLWLKYAVQQKQSLSWGACWQFLLLWTHGVCRHLELSTLGLSLATGACSSHGVWGFQRVGDMASWDGPGELVPQEQISTSDECELGNKYPCFSPLRLYSTT